MICNSNMLYFLRNLLLLNYILTTVSGFVVSPAPFSDWFAIDFVKNIDKKKPFAFNVGELPLVAWFPDQENPQTTINICKHMGSSLDHGKVKNGCLHCPYHGLAHDSKDAFGKTMIYQDKLWWSYEPKNEKPPSIPYYNNKNYQTTFIKVDINANIVDCAFNTMDINHPAHVHNNIFGFGSNIPPRDISVIKYPTDKKKVGLTFSYKSNSNLIHLKRELKTSHNFHVYDYPYTTWSRVSLPTNEHLIVNVNLLPLEPNKTRWLVTLKHNFWNHHEFEKYLMKFTAYCILFQDKYQLDKQVRESALKKMMMYQVKLPNDDLLSEMKDLFRDYKFPDEKQVLDLYKYHIQD